MDEQDDMWEELSDKLERVTNLLSYLVAVEHDTIEKKAIVLSQLGLQPAEIATVCGTTGNTVRVALSMARRRKSRSKARKK